MKNNKTNCFHVNHGLVDSILESTGISRREVYEYWNSTLRAKYKEDLDGITLPTLSRDIYRHMKETAIDIAKIRALHSTLVVLYEINEEKGTLRNAVEWEFKDLFFESGVTGRFIEFKPENDPRKFALVDITRSGIQVDFKGLSFGRPPTQNLVFFGTESYIYPHTKTLHTIFKIRDDSPKYRDLKGQTSMVVPETNNTISNGEYFDTLGKHVYYKICSIHHEGIPKNIRDELLTDDEGAVFSTQCYDFLDFFGKQIGCFK